MSAEHTDQADTTAGEQPTTWWEDVTDYWGRVWALTWRTVFPPREDYL
jgi:hypothetical protein